MSRAAEKLRSQDSLAGAIQVYIRTNVFKPEVPQYQRSMTVPLPEASADTRVLVGWAIKALRRIYRPGYGYHKAGITLMEIVPRVNQQFSLFVVPGSGEQPERPVDGHPRCDQRTLWAWGAPAGRGGDSQGLADAAGADVTALHHRLGADSERAGGLRLTAERMKCRTRDLASTVRSNLRIRP